MFRSILLLISSYIIGAYLYLFLSRYYNVSFLDLKSDFFIMTSKTDYSYIFEAFKNISLGSNFVFLILGFFILKVCFVLNEFRNRYL